jgi:uncharacterized protein DUF998
MTTSVKRIEEQLVTPKRLLACGVMGPLFFILVFLIEGATRVDYNPLRQPVSSLSIGELGWMQQTNFIITGSLLIAFAIGLLRSLRTSLWGPLLLGLVGVGLIGAGIYIADPLNGYPPGTPLIPTVRSEHGKLHDLFGVPVFLGLPAACFVFARQFARLGERGWVVYSVLSGIGMFATFVLAGMGFRQVPGFTDFAGVFQRLSLIIGLGWIALLAVHLLRDSPAWK